MADELGNEKVVLAMPIDYSRPAGILAAGIKYLGLPTVCCIY